MHISKNKLRSSIKKTEPLRASLEKIGSDQMSKIRTEDSLAEGDDMIVDAKYGVPNSYGISSSHMTRTVDPNSPEAIQH